MANWPVLSNQAAAGALSGMYAGRQTGLGPRGAALLPADLALQSACAQAFGQAFDAALTLLYDADLSPPTGLGANGGLITIGGEPPSSSSQVFSTGVTTAAETNVAFSYPPAAFGFCLAIVQGRALPTDTGGVPFTEADWTSSGVAAVAARQFYEWVKAGVVSTM